MKQYILGLFLLCLGGIAVGQVIVIKDINTMLPLAKVKVYSGTENYLMSDLSGKVDYSAQPNSGFFSFVLNGYEMQSLYTRDLDAADWTVLMVPNSYSLDDIVLSASKFEEKRKDIAQPVEILRAKDLAFMNQSTMADVMQNSGNVLVQKSQLGGGSPIIRGFETNKVLMVVDGVRMNNAIYRGGHLQNIITLDNTVMDNVEILFGPGSVVYGSDALGGVMSFTTKNPTMNTGEGLLVKANAFTRYASTSNEITGHADVSLAGQRFGSLTSVTYSNFGDLRQGGLRNPFYPSFGSRNFYQATFNGLDSVVQNPDSNVQVGSAYSQYDIFQKFQFLQSAKVKHTLNLQFSNSSDVPRYDRLTQVGGNGNPSYAEWYYGPQQRLFAAYRLDLSEGGKLYDQGRIIVAYQNIVESRNDRRFGSDNLNQRTEQLDIFSLNADFARKIQHHEIRYGLEGSYNKVNSSAERLHPSTGLTEALDTRYPNGGSSMRSLALYATHSWEISPKLVLNDGLRLSQVGLQASWTDTTFFPFPFKDLSQNNLSLNGNVGLVYSPGHQWRFSLLGSTGFRAPNVDDLSKVFESVPGNVIVPNPNLKPENTYNIDLGIRKRFGKEVTIGANAFYTLYRNAITTGLSTFQGQDSILYDGQLSQVTTSINAAEAYIYGGSAYIGFDFNPHFRLVNTINYTYGRLKTDTTDYPLDHIAPMFGKTSLQLNIKKFRGEFFVMWNGWKRLKDYNLVGEDNIAFATAQGMPAWMTLNIRGAYQVNQYLSFQAAVENILDQNYRVFASNISAPGRNFVLTVRGTF